MNGSDEAVPGGSFEMAEASAYMYDWLHYAELTEPERNYSSDFIYMVLTVDASELNDGTAEISLEDTVLYVPDIAAESIDWLFTEMKS